MKRIIKISLLLLIIGFFTGCNISKDIGPIMTCKTIIDNPLGKENISIEFYESSNTIRTVKQRFKKEKDTKKMIEALKQNYCNSEIKENYICDANIVDKEIILKEESTINNILGIKEDRTIKEYKRILEEKGFKCE